LLRNCRFCVTFDVSLPPAVAGPCQQNTMVACRKRCFTLYPGEALLRHAKARDVFHCLRLYPETSYRS
jgi:hypothetical protein